MRRVRHRPVSLLCRVLGVGDSVHLRYLWSRRAQKRTETAFGWPLTLVHPRMVPVVLKMHWHGIGVDDLTDDAAAQARAEELARSLGLRGVMYIS